jgi:hypothetical protein
MNARECHRFADRGKLEKQIDAGEAPLLASGREREIEPAAVGRSAAT